MKRIFSVAILLLPVLFLNLTFPNLDFSQNQRENMIDVGGYKLHCRVFGKGAPAIVLVNGANVDQSYWDPVIPALAAETTVITYNRAGNGKSGIGNRVYHGKQQAEDLKSLLDNLGIPGPYVLIGHSFGGFFVRLFASLYPQSTAGLILEDATHEDVTEYRLRRLKGDDLKLVQSVVNSPAPKNSLPGPTTEISAREITEQQVREITSMPQVPFLVISAGEPLPRSKISQEGNRIMHEIKIELHKKYLDLIPGGNHIIVKGTVHTIHSEKPEAFIEPVLELLERARK
jgi:pimeloyl-ACP methyl ester carboxylesterase